MEGTPARALLWSLAAGVMLLAWPWLLAWLQRVRPAWLDGTRVIALGDLRRGLDRPGRLQPGTGAAWLALATAAALLPAGRGLLAADLDVGAFWLAGLVLLTLPWLNAGGLARATGGLTTLALCLTPVALRAASLNLADLAIAQQGGAGNWFLLRDPFLMLAGLVFLLTVATLWPAPRSSNAGGPQLLLDAALRTGLPLVLAHLFVVVFLGGWWAFTTFLDGAALLNTVLKTVAVVGVVLLLRRRPAWVDDGHLRWVLPVAGLICAAGGAIWMFFTGAAW